jgi:hypothetical protein
MKTKVVKAGIVWIAYADTKSPHTTIDSNGEVSETVFYHVTRKQARLALRAYKARLLAEKHKFQIHLDSGFNQYYVYASYNYYLWKDGKLHHGASSVAGDTRTDYGWYESLDEVYCALKLYDKG